MTANSSMHVDMQHKASVAKAVICMWNGACHVAVHSLSDWWSLQCFDTVGWVSRRASGT